MVRISRALEIGEAFSHHDARDLSFDEYGPNKIKVENLRAEKDYIYILIAPMRIDAKRLDMVMDFLHKMAKEKCMSRISFSGNYEDAKTKGWFDL